MAYTLSNKCAKNLPKRTVLLQLIIKNVVTCFLEHSVDVVTTVCGSAIWCKRTKAKDRHGVAKGRHGVACRLNCVIHV